MSDRIIDYSYFTHQFKFNYLETENMPIEHPVSSENILAGGHLWKIQCYPRGRSTSDNGEWISIFLHHESESKDAKAIFEALVMDKDGAVSSSDRISCVRVYTPKGSAADSWGWEHFMKRSVLKSLQSLYVANGSFTIACGIKVIEEDPLDVPPSDIGIHLGSLLECTDGGSDVSFVVDGEKFPAHRAVLAARSPVFKAQLPGSMVDASMPSIPLLDIAPATFKAMLRFIYTDTYPADAGLEMCQDLLAAADRFALDRLKFLCASKLWDNVSEVTVAATIICAETYNCPQLKKKCIDFIAEEKNFKTVVLTDGFLQLAQQFPSILADLREKVGSS